jgi:tRNA G37 N-methylase TrmD
MWRASVLTIFPDMFPGPLGASLAGKALANGAWSLDVVDIRAFRRPTSTAPSTTRRPAAARAW